MLCHHERPDGTGYPDRLADDEIPLEAKIISVADAFEAIVSWRPYRAARSVRDAVAELERCAGTQFDVRCVTALVAALSPEHEEAVAEDVDVLPAAYALPLGAAPAAA